MHKTSLSSPQHPSKPFITLILLFACVNAQNGTAVGGSLCERIRLAVSAQNQGEIGSLVKQAEKHMHVPCFMELVPRYYWAQNMSHIFVKFQYLNSASTSACSKVLSIQKDISYQHISVTLICLQSSHILRYHIHIKTYMPLNHFHSIWKSGSHNTIILECLKSPSPYFWKSLYVGSHVPLRKPKIWWKVQERYQQNIGNFIYELQTYEDEDDISGYVKRKNKVKKTKLTEQYNPHSDRYLYCNQNNPFQLGSWIF